MVEYKTYDTLQNQIWSLLPGFCTNPTDLEVNYFRFLFCVSDFLLNELIFYVILSDSSVMVCQCHTFLGVLGVILDVIL